VQHDPIVEALVALIHDTCESALRSAIQDRAINHVIDSIGCAIGALDQRAAPICHTLARASACDTGASVIGLATRTTPEIAAFTNTSLIRNLDFNDTGIGGHPSDMLGALIAIAETSHASGLDLIRGMHCAYEAFAGLRRAGLRLRRQHVDQLQVVLGAVCGCAAILRLNDDQTRHAISLALVPNVPLRVTRTGSLSDWKGSATAHAAMSAVFAARLASLGMTAPATPFAGTAGLYELLQIEPWDHTKISPLSGSRPALCSVGLKRFPAEYSAQGPIAMAISVRDEVSLEQIESVTVALHYDGWHEIGGGQGDRAEKWRPINRESADHSLPFLVASALHDGDINLSTYDEARLCAPQILALIDCITVTHDQALTQRHAGEIPAWPSRMTIRSRNGDVLVRDTDSPCGHPNNPMSAYELRTKFDSLCGNRLDKSSREALIHVIETLPEGEQLGALLTKLRAIPVSFAR
jgi:2-methylcitrate dehydratase